MLDDSSHSLPGLRVAAAILVTAALGICSGMWLTHALAPEAVMAVPEAEMWKAAVGGQLPTYPPDAGRVCARGVLVARIVREPDGGVRDVEVLESPDDALSAEVRRVVAQWRFAPAAGVSAGKVTFYFGVEDGLGFVAVPGRDLAAGRQPSIQAGDAQGQAPNKEGARTIGGWSLPKSVRFISEDEFSRRTGQPKTVALDVRSQANYTTDHRPGTINIPRGELSKRAGELAGFEVILLDCSRNSADSCPLSTWVLDRLGAREIAVLARPR